MEQKEMVKDIHRWLLTMPGAKKVGDGETIEFEHVDFLPRITFYDWSYIELSILKKDNKELVFYQQYEPRDKVGVKQVIGTFFHVLASPRNSIAKYGTMGHSIPGNLKVIISCSSGASSSWFAKLLRERIEQTGLHIQVDSTSVWDLEKKLENYDVVLLTPQINYRYKELAVKYGDRFIKLLPLDYATRNTDSVLHQIGDWYEKRETQNSFVCRETNIK